MVETRPPDFIENGRLPGTSNEQSGRFFAMAFILLGAVAALAFGNGGYRADSSDYPTRTLVPAVLTMIPAAADCRVAPRSVESVIALIDAGAATPSSSLTLVPTDRGAPSLVVDGTPWVKPGKDVGTETVDPAIVAGVSTTMREFVACGNAGDVRRMLSLFTDAGVARTFSRSALIDEQGGGLPWYPWRLRIEDPLATPNAAPQLVPGRIRQVRVLPDGRVGVIADLDTSADNVAPDALRVYSYGLPRLIVFVNVGDRWLIDQVITGIPI